MYHFQISEFFPEKFPEQAPTGLALPSTKTLRDATQTLGEVLFTRTGRHYKHCRKLSLWKFRCYKKTSQTT